MSITGAESLPASVYFGRWSGWSINTYKLGSTVVKWLESRTRVPELTGPWFDSRPGAVLWQKHFIPWLSFTQTEQISTCFAGELPAMDQCPNQGTILTPIRLCYS